MELKEINIYTIFSTSLQVLQKVSEKVLNADGVK